MKQKDFLALLSTNDKTLSRVGIARGARGYGVIDVMSTGARDIVIIVTG